MDTTETKIRRSLLDAVRRRAAREGRDELELVEEALRRYLATPADPISVTRLESPRSSEGRRLDELLADVKAWQEERGVEPLSDDAAIALAVEEQHEYRRGESSGPSSTPTSWSPPSLLPRGSAVAS